MGEGNTEVIDSNVPLTESMHSTTDTESSQTEAESSDDGEDPLLPFVDDSSESSTSSLASSESTASQESTTTSAQYQNRHKLLTYKLVGDNIDKEVRPRQMRSDHQTRSLHYFHTYAVRDRIDLSGISDQAPSVQISSIDLTKLLPNADDDECLRRNFAILIARVLRQYSQYFSRFGQAVEGHIEHKYSREMSFKSEVVCSCYSSIT